jgi:colanic acid/amylovoran biosynthesis glycosyltransferase
LTEAPLRVVYVVNEYPTVSETFVYREIEALRATGAQVHVFPLRVRSAKDAPDYLLRPLDLTGRLSIALPVLLSGGPAVARALLRSMLRLNPREWSREVYAAVWAAALVGSLRRAGAVPDFLHAHFLARCTDVARYVQLLTGGELRFSATAHAGEVYGRQEPWLLRHRVAAAQGVVGVSHHILERVRALRPGVPATVVRCGVVPEEIPPARPPQVFSVVSVGRLVPQKGLVTCVDAAALLRDRGIEFEWAVVGEGPLRTELERAIARHRLSGCVRLLGARTSDETLRQIARAHCFVLPCQEGPNGETDGIPVALMEAMASGLPVVSSPVAGVPELVEDEVSGLLVRSRDPFALAGAVARLAGDPALRERLSSAADVRHLRNRVERPGRPRRRRRRPVRAAAPRP